MIKVRLQVNDHEDRADLVKGLANSGYPVYVEKKNREGIEFGPTYCVIFEVPDDSVQNDIDITCKEWENGNSCAFDIDNVCHDDACSLKKMKEIKKEAE